MGILDIFSDMHYIDCMILAKQSKGYERYGSIIIKEGIILGKGYNRAIAHPYIGKLDRIIKQGMSNHAEVEALNDAIINGFNVSGSSLYVAGYFYDSGKLFFKTKYTCTKCIPYMKKFGIANVYIPTVDGWISKSLDLADKEAKEFTVNTHKKRLNIASGNFYFTQLGIDI